MLLCVGEPPRTRGTSSSTTADSGCQAQPGQLIRGHFGPCCPAMRASVLSTGLSHRAHRVSSARTRFTNSRRRCPLALVPAMPYPHQVPPVRYSTPVIVGAARVGYPHHRSSSQGRCSSVQHRSAAMPELYSAPQDSHLTMPHLRSSRRLTRGCS